MYLIIDDNNSYQKIEIRNNFKHKAFEIVKNKNFQVYTKDNYVLKNKNFNVDYGIYLIESTISKEEYRLYVYEQEYDLSLFKLYEINQLHISNSPLADICIIDDFLQDIDLLVKDAYILGDSQFLRVNNKRYRGEKLKFSDRIEILGIEIIYFDKYLYINPFNNKINLQYQLIEGISFVFKKEYLKQSSLIIPINNKVKLKKLKPFENIRKNNSKNTLIQIGPAITMSLSMSLVAYINIYNSYINNGYSISLIAMAIMPFSIILTSIMWPLIAKKYDHKIYLRELRLKELDHLKYLKNYSEEAQKEIDEYKRIEYLSYFDLKNVERKLLYIPENSKQFLKITIGLYSQELDFDVSLSGNKKIDDELIKVKNSFSKISNLPLYLSLIKNKRITYVSNDRKYHLKKILLELAYKYDYKDIRIVVYSKDETIFSDFYRIPHSFDGSKRLLYSDDLKLCEINSLKSERRTIILTTDYINSEIVDDYCLVFFSDSKRNVLKDSETIIEINDYDSMLIDNSITSFTCTKEKFNFKKAFDYISNCGIDLIEKDNTFINNYENIDVYNNYLIKQENLSAKFAIVDKKMLDFDIHESKDGPHGLIGGSTGSGKSELIVSLLLSLAIRYRPDYLSIVLIDYKGGGIKESLTYNSHTVPHIVASINNLEEGILERLVVCIDKNLKKRQVLFKELSHKSNVSIVNIDEYLNLCEKYGFEKLTHLLIVVDEFAEMKKQSPEIIKELISFSRIGRSLGIHLILATQRPNGVIDEEIWSNSHFKLALKVHSASDSRDLIHSDVAANLSKPGEFYLKEDDRLLKGFSLYSKNDLELNGNYSVSLLDLNLCSIKTYKNNLNKQVSEASYLLQTIIDTCDKLNILADELDYKKPNSCSLLELKNKYSVDALVFGEIDDYLNNKKGILAYSYYENLLLVSSRNNEINTILCNLNNIERRIIIVSNAKYGGKNICDCINYEDGDDLNYLFYKLDHSLDEDICILIEDINLLLSYDDYLDKLLKLLRKSDIAKYNVILLAKTTNIHFKIINSVKNRLLVSSKDKQDILNLFFMKSQYNGNSYFCDAEPVSFVETLLPEFDNSLCLFNSFLDKIPDCINLDFNDDQILIGYYVDFRNKFYIRTNETILIVGYNDQILNRLSVIYRDFKNVVIETYTKMKFLNDFSSIVWVGEGINRQSLFYPERNLKDGENYVYRNGRCRQIKLVDYE